VIEVSKSTDANQRGRKSAKSFKEFVQENLIVAGVLATVVANFQSSPVPTMLTPYSGAVRSFEITANCATRPESIGH
jgi:hypothetical protein